MLPGKVAEDGHGLGQLDVPIKVVREVGEVQTKVELDLGPLIHAVVPLLLVLDAQVFQQEADGLAELEFNERKHGNVA